MRLGERWRLEFEYYTLKRTGTKTIDRQIDWGDTCRSPSAPRSRSDVRHRRSTDSPAGYSFLQVARVPKFGPRLRPACHRLQHRAGGVRAPVRPAPASTDEAQRRAGAAADAGPVRQLQAVSTGLRGLRGRVDYLSPQVPGLRRQACSTSMATLDWRFSQALGRGPGLSLCRLQGRRDEVGLQRPGQVQVQGTDAVRQRGVLAGSARRQPVGPSAGSR